MGIRDKEIIETQYGPLWSGVDKITIGDTLFTLSRIKRAFDLEANDVVGIDLHVLDGGRFAFRFYDGDDRTVVVFVFDKELNIVLEHRAHIAEWLSDEYYQSGMQAFVPEDMVLMLRRKVFGERDGSTG